jgi:hypothetical protein
MIVERAEAIPEILDMLQTRHPERRGSGRVAILVAQEHDAGVSDVVANNARPALLDIRVFSDYVNAARWLAGDDV